MRTLLQFHSPVPYFNLMQNFIAKLLQNNVTTQQLFVIILNCIEISDRSKMRVHFYSVTSFVNRKLITLPS